MLHLSLLTLRAHGYCCSKQYGMNSINCYQSLKVQLKVDCELSNFDDDCIEGGSKVQPCDAVSHVLAAHKSASFEKNFRIELLHYYKVAVVIFFFAVRIGVNHCLSL